MNSSSDVDTRQILPFVLLDQSFIVLLICNSVENTTRENHVDSISNDKLLQIVDKFKICLRSKQ